MNHVLREVLEIIDLPPITSISEAENRGYPQYHPNLMVGILFSVCCHRITSSLKILTASWLVFVHDQVDAPPNVSQSQASYAPMDTLNTTHTAMHAGMQSAERASRTTKT